MEHLPIHDELQAIRYAQLALARGNKYAAHDESQ